MCITKYFRVFVISRKKKILREIQRMLYSILFNIILPSLDIFAISMAIHKYRDDNMMCLWTETILPTNFTFLQHCPICNK